MHRSQSRERLRGACDPRSTFGCEPISFEPMNAEGYVQYRNYIEPSRIELGTISVRGAPTESNSTIFDFKSSSKKTRTPVRAALAQEMSTETQIKRSSPSVIARLMGLDALPSPVFLKPHGVSSCSRKGSSKELQNLTAREDCLLKNCSDEYQECKDVFEVIEGQQIENHRKQDIRKQMANLKHCEMDMAFIRQSFINAKRLSTDERLQRSKEFDDALEVLESNRDLFLKLLQEPHSLFSEHLQSRSQSSFSQPASYGSTRKSSREGLTTNHDSSLISEINVGRYTNPRSSDSESLRHHAANSNGHPFSEPFSLPGKYSDSIYGRKVEDYIPPTHIVVLKPNLKKARKDQRTIRSVTSLEKSKRGVINHRELSNEEIIDLFRDEKDRQYVHALGNMRPGVKQTAELAKNVTQQMRNNSFSGRKASVQKYSNYVQDDDVCRMSSIGGAMHSSVCYKAYDNIHHYSKNFSPLTSCVIESSVNMEGRKHQSERRKLTCNLQEVGLSMRSSHALSEKLVLSDKDISKTAIHMSAVKKARPSVVSGKDGLSRNPSRSKSLPASSLVYESSQHVSRNGVIGSRSRAIIKNMRNMKSELFVDEEQIGSKNSSLKNLGEHPNKNKLRSYGEESRLPVRKIHVKSGKFEHRPLVIPLSEEVHTICNLSDIHNPDTVDIFSVPSCNNSELSFSMKLKGLEELQEMTYSERNGEDIECGHNEMLSKPELSCKGGDVLLPSNCSKSAAAVSPIHFAEVDQPSPVSVLDTLSNDDKPTPGCFEKISADLQELRRQLQILKFDSQNDFTKEIESFISSDEDVVEPFSQMEDIHQSFRDEEDRDYSYLLDMLIDSQVLKSEKIGLLGACYLTEFPVGIDVFDKLEKKYELFGSWSRSGRKLLFDLVNSTVADIAAVPFMNKCLLMRPRLCWQPKIAHEGLVEEIWQAVSQRRKELSSYSEADLTGLKWFGFGNTYSEVVGSELENMLSENLMDELVEELIYM